MILTFLSVNPKNLAFLWLVFLLVSWLEQAVQIWGNRQGSTRHSNPGYIP